MASNKSRRKLASVGRLPDAENHAPDDVRHAQADGSTGGEEEAASASRAETGELKRLELAINSVSQVAVGGEGKERRTNMPINVALGANIRRLRVGLNLSQAHLAHAADITAGHLGEIERGSTGPGSTTLAKLALALGVTLGPIYPERHELAKMFDLEDDAQKADDTHEDSSTSLLGQDGLALGDAADGAHPVRTRVADYVEVIDLPDGWVIDPDGNAFSSRGGTRVELLLSGSRVAELLHINDRTLQKWVAQRLLTPSFYVAQGRLGGSTSDIPWKPRLIAAFRLSDLPDAIEVRAGARVRKQGDKRSAIRKKGLEGSS